MAFSVKKPTLYAPPPSQPIVPQTSLSENDLLDRNVEQAWLNYDQAMNTGRDTYDTIVQSRKDKGDPEPGIRSATPLPKAPTYDTRRQAAARLVGTALFPLIMRGFGGAAATRQGSALNAGATFSRGMEQGFDQAAGRDIADWQRESNRIMAENQTHRLEDTDAHQRWTGRVAYDLNDRSRFHDDQIQSTGTRYDRARTVQEANRAGKSMENQEANRWYERVFFGRTLTPRERQIGVQRLGKLYREKGIGLTKEALQAEIAFYNEHNNPPLKFEDFQYP